MTRLGLSFVLTFALAGCALWDRPPTPHWTVDAADAASQSTACPGTGEALAAMDAFMAAFNARDMAAWEATYVFPHVRMASGDVRVQAGPGELPADLFERLAATGWDHSQWIERRAVQCGPGKIHFATVFARYRADGSELSRFQSLYIMEEAGGRWGVRARSSYAP